MKTIKSYTIFLYRTASILLIIAALLVTTVHAEQDPFGDLSAAHGRQFVQRTTSSASNAGRPLTFAIYPYLSATELVERFTPLMNYLSRETGYTIRILVSKNYQEHIHKVGGDEYDFAYIGPASYVNMVKMYGQKPLLARLEIKGEPMYYGFIFVRQESSIRTISDLSGKSFAFGDPNSTMGHQVPRYMLWKEGIGVEKLSGYTFMENHVNVALAVLAGDYDAGAVVDETFYKYERRGLRALKKSPGLSEHLFVANKRMPSEMAQALRDAMFELKKTEAGKKVIAGIKSNATGLLPAKAEDYDSLRVILDGLQKIGVKSE